MLPWIAENTFSALLLAGVAVPLCLLARFRPAVCHLIWLLVLVRLVAPPLPFETWSAGDVLDWVAPASTERGTGTDADWLDAEPIQVMRLPVPQRSSGWAGEDKGRSIAWLGARELETASDVADGKPAREESAADMRPQESRADFVLPTATRPPGGPGTPVGVAAWDLAGQAALWVWLVGGLFVLARQARRALRFQRLVKAGDPAPADLCALVADVARRLDVSVPRVHLLATLGSPVVWSFGRPVLLWPADEHGRAVSTTSARGIVAHELAHLARRDHWVAWFEVAISALLWWHPLYWFARTRMHSYAELSCDAWAVWAYPHGRRDYAEALIDVAERMSAPTGPAPVLAVIEEEPREFERRLRMIMRERVSRRVSPVVAAAAVLATTFLLPVGTLAQESGWVVVDDGVKPKVERALMTQEAAALSSAGKWEQAAQAWSEVLEQDTQNGEAAHWLGYSRHMLGDYEGSLAAWKHQRTVGYQKENAEYNMACAYAMLEQEDGTLQHLVAAIQCGFDDKDQIEGDSDLDLIRHGAHLEELFAAIDDVAETKALAQQAVDKGDWEAAATSYGRLTRLTPEVGEPWHMQAYALIGLGEYDQAIASCERQIELGFKPATGSYNIACAQALAGRTDAAFASLKTSLEQGFANAELLHTDPDLESLRGDPRMEKLQARFASMNQKHAEAAKATEQGDWTEAVKAWTGLVEEGQADSYVASELGIARFRDGDYAGALAAFEEQVESGDDVDKGLYNMACAHAMLGQKEKAFECLGLAIDAGLDDPELVATDPDLGPLRDDARMASYVNRAADVAQLKAFGAVSWEHLLELSAERVLENQDDGQGYHRMGWANLRLGRYADAVDAFEAQNETGFSTDTATYNLACSYALMGEADPAFKWLYAAMDEGFLDAEHLVNDPDLANLHGDPRFKQIAAHMQAAVKTGKKSWAEEPAKTLKQKAKKTSEGAKLHDVR